MLRAILLSSEWCSCSLLELRVILNGVSTEMAKVCRAMPFWRILNVSWAQHPDFWMLESVCEDLSKRTHVKSYWLLRLVLMLYLVFFWVDLEILNAHVCQEGSVFLVDIWQYNLAVWMALVHGTYCWSLIQFCFVEINLRNVSVVFFFEALKHHFEFLAICWVVVIALFKLLRLQ